MCVVRIPLFIALVLGASFIAKAANYILPTGVTVLTEEQLLNQIIGNTFVEDRWVEYFEPAANGQKEGRLKGLRKGTPYTGKWTISKALMCWQYDQAFQATYDTCYTTALKGTQVIWYQTDGTIIYPPRGRPKLKKGNPENL